MQLCAGAALPLQVTLQASLPQLTDAPWQAVASPLQATSQIPDEQVIAAPWHEAAPLHVTLQA
jgi:hypothetical protein